MWLHRRVDHAAAADRAESLATTLVISKYLHILTRHWRVRSTCYYQADALI
jgi:hypothetical protein